MSTAVVSAGASIIDRIIAQHDCIYHCEKHNNGTVSTSSLLQCRVCPWAPEFGARQKMGSEGFQIGRVRTGCLVLVEKV